MNTMNQVQLWSFNFNLHIPVIFIIKKKNEYENYQNLTGHDCIMWA